MLYANRTKSVRHERKYCYGACELKENPLTIIIVVKEAIKFTAGTAFICHVEKG